MSKKINKKGGLPILFHRKNTTKGQFRLQIITLCEGNGASIKTKEGREFHIHGLKRPGLAPDRGIARILFSQGLFHFCDFPTV